MLAQVVCEPLLGQTSVEYGQSIAFTVLLIPIVASLQWEVAIWHNNSETQQWVQTDLSLSRHGVQNMGEDFQGQPNLLFTGNVERSTKQGQVVHFTLKYRVSGQEWNWVNDQSDSGDGEIIFSQGETISEFFPHYIESCDSLFSVFKNDQSASNDEPDPETHVWSLESTVPAATEQSAFHSIKIGMPIDISRWFCLARESRPWLCPRQGRGKFSPEEDAILVSFLRQDGFHLVLLALSLDDILTVIKPDDEGNIIAVVRNDRRSPGKAHVVVAVGKTFEDANKAAIRQAKSITATSSAQGRTNVDLMTKEIQTGDLESWYDSFAYCTWNGLGQSLTESKILQALETMSKTGIFLSTLIIDDNWQSIDAYGSNNFHHRWLEFEADRKAFPNGLKHTISSIRNKYPHIKHIAVWHGILGYWNGIAPDGPLSKCYRIRTLKKQDNGFFGGGSLVAVDADDAKTLYNDFYEFLADCGIDSVKTDTQFLLDQLEDPIDRTRFISKYQDAWLTATLQHFSAKAISCMSQIPQILFHSQLPSTLPRLMARNSEDFFPDEPSSHPWHIFCNAHNNVLTQHLNVLPDWDMFQTSHEYSAFHAAARCISGGPIYFTDKPGEHDMTLIKQMSARNVEETIILRPKVARSSYVYASNKETRLLRIATSTVETGTPMLGIFNINERPVSELVFLEHFLDAQNGQPHIIRAHTSGKLSEPVNWGSRVAHLLKLEVKGYEILTAYSVRTIRHPIKGTAVSIAVLGLIDKMTGAAAVQSTAIIEDNEEFFVKVELKAFGRLGLYISSADKTLKISGAKLCGVAVPEEVVVLVLEQNLVSFELEKAWELIRGESLLQRKILFELRVAWR